MLDLSVNSLESILKIYVFVFQRDQIDINIRIIGPQPCGEGSYNLYKKIEFFYYILETG